MQNVKIKKAKLKDELFLEGEYTEELPGHSKNDTKISSTVPVHQDLKDAMQKLHAHLAILCDVGVKAPKKKEFGTADYPEFTVKGFSIGGNDENEGITISGYKEGVYGLVNLNTPFTKYENDTYPFTEELNMDVEAVLHEVEQYLFHEKKAPEKQLSMEFEDEEPVVEEGEMAAGE